MAWQEMEDFRRGPSTAKIIHKTGITEVVPVPGVPASLGLARQSRLVVRILQGGEWTGAIEALKGER